MRHRLARLIAHLLPTDPAKAIHPDVLADRLGLKASIPGILANIPGLTRDGERRVYRDPNSTRDAGLQTDPPAAEPSIPLRKNPNDPTEPWTPEEFMFLLRSI